MRALRQETGASVGSVAETAGYSDVLFMALSWEAIPTAVETGDWGGKILIDASNRFGPGISLLPGESAGQELARLTGARVVKAFNTIGAEHYLQPVIGGEAASMLIAGDDAEAKQVVVTLAAQLGFVPVDAGALSAAVYLESLAALWVHLAIRTPLGRDFAFPRDSLASTHSARPVRAPSLPSSPHAACGLGTPSCRSVGPQVGQLSLQMPIKKGHDPLSSIDRRRLVIACVDQLAHHRQQPGHLGWIGLIEKGVSGIGVFLYVVVDSKCRQCPLQLIGCPAQRDIFRSIGGDDRACSYQKGFQVLGHPTTVTGRVRSSVSPDHRCVLIPAR